MRVPALVLSLGVLGGCEPPLRPAALPTLVAAQAPRAISVPFLRLPAGESSAWEVHVAGVTIGRAELEIGEAEVRSRFATSRLASSFARVRHELVTRLDAPISQQAPRESIDELELDDERTSVTSRFAGSRVVVDARPVVIPGGHLGHTWHTALGAIRAWATASAAPGFLYVVHAGVVLKLEVGQPQVEAMHATPALRIEGAIESLAVQFTLWLRADDRLPVRIEVRTDEGRATAELVAP